MQHLHVQYMLLFLVPVVNFRQLHALTLAACFYLQFMLLFLALAVNFDQFKF